MSMAQPSKFPSVGDMEFFIEVCTSASTSVH
jgi:hypothetical protein